jgi:cysteinyl-tRNA synthetase
VLRWDFKTGKRVHDEKENPSQGFPGWHIECSAMSRSLLGDQIDIHTGGEDNIFPHHESEIAQTCAITGKPFFAKYWLHKRHIFVDGIKMSKSLGNFYTLSDIEAKGFSPVDFRYLILSVHYRQNTNFSWKSLEDSKKAITHLQLFLEMLEQASSQGSSVQVQKHRADFEKALDDDLNTSGALAAVFELVKEGNSMLAKHQGVKNKLEVLKFMRDFDHLFAVLNWDALKKPDREVQELIQERDQARDAKDYKKSDQIREQLKKMGIELMDQDGKTIWRKIASAAQFAK